MQNVTLILLLAAMAAIAFYMGRRRSLAVVGGPAHGMRLHSLPGYYGYFTLIACLLPALGFFFLWVLLEPRVIVALVIQGLPDAQRGLPPGELNLLVKGDVSGSVEAVCDAMMNLSNEKVTVNVIHRSVGGINENDIMLAAASDAIVIGFHLRPDPATRQLAVAQHVDLKIYDIIYEALDEIRAAMHGMLDPVFEEQIIGHAEVLPF